MDPTPVPHIVFSDRLDDGIVVGFDNGKSAFYPARLLYEVCRRRAGCLPIRLTARCHRTDISPSQGDFRVWRLRSGS
jgi:hypothetical protein